MDVVGWGVAGCEGFSDGVILGAAVGLVGGMERGAMKCLRCGHHAQHPGPCGGWACFKCGFQWEIQRGVLSYWKETYRDKTSFGGHFEKTPIGTLAVFGWDEK